MAKKIIIYSPDGGEKECWEIDAKEIVKYCGYSYEKPENKPKVERKKAAEMREDKENG